MPVIEKHKTFVDYVVDSCGSVEGLFTTALLNGVGITDELAAGTEVVALPARLTTVEATITAPVQQPDLFRLKKQQTLFDFTTQLAGSFEAIFEMAMLNNISITEQVSEGTALGIKPQDEKVIRFFTNKALDVVSINSSEDVLPGGIGYMQIQNNFKVS